MFNFDLKLIDFVIVEIAMFVLIQFNLELEEILLLFKVGFTLTHFENLVSQVVDKSLSVCKLLFVVFKGDMGFGILGYIDVNLDALLWRKVCLN